MRMAVMEGATKLTPTSLIRVASGFFGIYFDRSPAGMRAETSCGGEMVAPRRGRMFGCFKLFHIMASLQNNFNSCVNMCMESGGVDNSLRYHPGWLLANV